MSSGAQTAIGSVISLWRYPVRSMMGEELNSVRVTDRGLIGDRAYVLLDSSDGKAATAKNPTKWPTLFDFQAAFIEPTNSAEVPGVQVRLPDGRIVTSEHSEHNQVLSTALNRKVTLAVTERGRVTGVWSSLPVSWTGNAEEHRPDMEGLDYRDTVTDFAVPSGILFEGAAVHMLTTATLKRLGDHYPNGRFEIQRFRPNIVVEALEVADGYPENGWIGHTLDIGEEVRLNITGPCPRCVMTTLAQGQLPNDSEILRTVVQQNEGNAGVYAAVVRGGTIRRGDQAGLGA